MTHKEICEHIVLNMRSIEAAIIISVDGLPLAWYSMEDTAIDEVTSISAGLLAVARELVLFNRDTDASMVFDTSFGALAIINLDIDSLLALCLTDNNSFPTIHRRIRKLLQTAS